jgi:hypothetical protein
MQFKISQYEFKDYNSDDWQEVSEIIVLGKLAELYERLTPLLSEMLQGKEIITAEGIFRMKNGGNGGKDY